MRFGILLFPKVEELDFVGPWELLTMWSKHAHGPEQCLTVAQSRAPVECAKGLSVNPDSTFDHCPVLDYLLVPGGQGTRTEVGNPTLIDFVASQASGCKAVLSVCTGAFILHAAGLLSGKKVTTHWKSLERLRQLGDVVVVESRFVRDGHIWTSAGISAGMDLMLAFIATVGGEEAAGKVQSLCEYYPAGTRYGDFSRNPSAPRYLSMTEES